MEKGYFQNLLAEIWIMTSISESNQVASTEIHVNIYFNATIPLLKDYPTEIRVLRVKIWMSRMTADWHLCPALMCSRHGLTGHQSDFQQTACMFLCLKVLPEPTWPQLQKSWGGHAPSEHPQAITGVNWHKYPRLAHLRRKTEACFLHWPWELPYRIKH